METRASEPGDDLRGYDSIVAITQDTINSQLLSLYYIGLIDNEISEDDAEGSVDTVVLAPTVTLRVGEGGDPQNVILNLSFGRGELSVGHGAEGVTYQLEEVSLGFRSVLGRRSVPKALLLESRMVTAEVKDAFRDVDEEEFTVEHIYISLKETVTPRSLFETRGLSDTNAIKVLVELLAKHYAEGEELGPFGIGFQAVLRGTDAASPDDDIPPLVPTSVDYSLTLNRTNPGWSTFNFLIMTASRPAPEPKRYVKLQMVDSADLQGRYLVAERLILQGGLLGRIQKAVDPSAAFVRDDAAGDFRLRAEVPVARLEKDVQGSRLVLEMNAYPECRVSIRKGARPLLMDIEFITLMEAKFTLDGRPGERSPLRVTNRFGGSWKVELRGRERLHLTGRLERANFYEADRNYNSVSRADPSQLSPALYEVRQALSGFAGGAWPELRYSELLNIDEDLNTGRVVLPLGRDFFFSDLTIDGDESYNLRVNLTYKE